jgi:hypothetical protein
MTTPAQKQTETAYVKAFLDGLIEYDSLDPCEPPDFWIRLRTPPDIALEVVEYHPNTDSGIRRTQVEASWWKNLEPLVIQNCASIMDVSVHLTLNEKRLPKKKDCEGMAADLVRLVETVVSNPNFHNADTTVEFGKKRLATGERGSAGLGRQERQGGTGAARGQGRRLCRELEPRRPPPRCRLLGRDGEGLGGQDREGGINGSRGQGGPGLQRGLEPRRQAPGQCHLG